MVRHRKTFAVALGENAAWVNPQDITQTMSGSQTVWKVVLQENSHGQDINLDRDATFGNISADQIAEMRAKRILLNEKLEPARPSFNLVDELNQRELESLIRGSCFIRTRPHPRSSRIPYSILSTSLMDKHQRGSKSLLVWLRFSI